MLYILHKGNHPELTYRDGQRPIVHLQADLYTVIRWAETHQVPWAFSDRNASAHVAQFYNDPSKLSSLDWFAVSATDFRDSRVKEGKQAEFLMFDYFPWTLIEKVGTIDNTVATQAKMVIAGVEDRSIVTVERGWYF